jgi:hypothetical protein
VFCSCGQYCEGRGRETKAEVDIKGEKIMRAKVKIKNN